MDYNRAKAILEKYFDGISSLQEEEELMLYFSKMQDVPKELLASQGYVHTFQGC